MMNPMMGMGGMGGMQQMFMMMQMMQMMQMMMGMMGQQGGMYPGGGMPQCACGHQHMGDTMGMNYPMGPSMMPPYGGMPDYGPMSQAPQLDPSALRGSTPTGRALAESAMRTPVPPGCRPGYCYRGVKHHMRQIGVNLTGGSAYQAAPQIARSGKFNEVRVSRAQLKDLPAGAVVVWGPNQAAGKPHGHISIALGNGREASDKHRNQITNKNATYRVFIPK